MQTFKIYSISAGWIEGCLKDSKKKYYFDYSYLTNFTEDLMKALLCVFTDISEQENTNNFRAVWEPAEDAWKISLEKNKLYINIKNYEDDITAEYDEDITLEFNALDFLQDFINEMNKIIKKYGLLGYRKSWGYEFPTSLLLKLQDICSNNNILQIDVLTEEENFGRETEKTNLSSEIELLNNITTKPPMP